MRTNITFAPLRNIFFTLPLLALPAGGDAFQDGLKLLREGKNKEAFVAFQTAEAEAKDNASPELLFNKALAAYKSGDLHEAEASAEKAAAAGRAEFVTARDFLRGNIQYQRCEITEKEIDEKWAALNATGGNVNPGNVNPNGPPTLGPPAQPSLDLKLYDRAIAEAESARDAWVASASAAAAPEAAPALRNTERALLKIEELKKKKEEAEKKAKEQQDQNKDQKDDNKKDDDKNTESKPESRPDEKPESRPESQPSKDQENKDPQKKEDDPSQQNDPNDQNKNEQKENEAKQQQEADPTKLTQEQMKRMLDKLDEKEKQRQQLLKARARVLRVPKDW